MIGLVPITHKLGSQGTGQISKNLIIVSIFFTQKNKIISILIGKFVHLQTGRRYVIILLNEREGGVIHARGNGAGERNYPPKKGRIQDGV